jgi:COMM domain containing 10
MASKDEGKKNSLFTATSKFKSVASLINKLGDKKFKLLLKRVVQKLHIKGEKLFSDKEQEQLQKVLQLNVEELTTVLDGCSFIFEKAAYETVSPQTLESSLSQFGVEASKAATVGEVWKSEGKYICNCLAATTIAGPMLLSDYSWRATMKVGQSNAAKLRDSSVIFDFKTSSPDGNGEESSFAVEFDHEKLYDFFLSLERIQEQLDALG